MPSRPRPLALVADSTPNQRLESPTDSATTASAGGERPHRDQRRDHEVRRDARRRHIEIGRGVAAERERHAEDAHHDHRTDEEQSTLAMELPALCRIEREIARDERDRAHQDVRYVCEAHAAFLTSAS
jgi:hypothetical protein